MASKHIDRTPRQVALIALCALALPLAACGRDEQREKELETQLAAANTRADSAERHVRELQDAIGKLNNAPAVASAATMDELTSGAGQPQGSADPMNEVSGNDVAGRDPAGTQVAPNNPLN